MSHKSQLGFRKIALLMVVQQDEKLWEIYKGLEDEHKVGRLGKPEEVADAVVFLCTAPRFLSGTNLVIDGAAMCH